MTNKRGLTARPSNPYSVNVWAIAIDDRVRLPVGEAVSELLASEDKSQERRNF